MLQCIAATEKCCLVMLDYAGLTTGPHDLEQFLRRVN
jgi:hypothetical protein